MFSQAQALDYLGSKLTQRGKGGFEKRRKSKVRSQSRRSRIGSRIGIFQALCRI